MLKPTAKAAVYTGADKPFEIRTFPVTVPEGDMACMSLVASGICGTDLHIHSGRLHTEPEKIIGHEFVGKVELVGENVKNVKPGDYVIADIACPCGECLLCRHGDDANCVNMGVTNGGDPAVAPHLWGGYSEVNYTPAANLIPIPENVAPKTAAVYACAGPTTMHAFRMGRESGWRLDQTRVAVVQGMGAVGTFAVMYLKALGVETVVVVSNRRNAEKEAHMKLLGADEVLYLNETSQEDIIAHIRELTDGLGADLVYEASGGASAVALGVKLLRNRGFYFIPGQYSDRGEVPVPTHMITFGALRLVGSAQYSLSDVHDYIAFLQANPRLHAAIDSVVKTYTVEQVNRAFADLEAGTVTKALLVQE